MIIYDCCCLLDWAMCILEPYLVGSSKWLLQTWQLH